MSVEKSIVDESPHDLISLSEVNETTILNAIRIRFQDQNIYTSCGSVLMVLNPFAAIDNLYGDAQINYYSNPYADGLTPHIYIISSRAYSLMCSFGRNQSILIRYPAFNTDCHFLINFPCILVVNLAQEKQSRQSNAWPF